MKQAKASKLAKRRCAICGAEYQPLRVNQLYCTHECKDEAKRARTAEYDRARAKAHLCPICGKPAPNRLYCSDECRTQALNRKRKQIIEEAYKGERPCIDCSIVRCSTRCAKWEAWFVVAWDKQTAILRKKLGLAQKT